MSIALIWNPYPGPRKDPKSVSLTKGVPINYPSVVRVPKSGIHFLDPPGILGTHPYYDNLSLNP